MKCFTKFLHRLSECENYRDQYHKIVFFYAQNVVNFAALLYNDYTFYIIFYYILGIGGKQWDYRLVSIKMLEIFRHLALM